MHADPEVMVDAARPLTREKSDRKLDRYVAGFARDGFCQWAVESLDGAFVGYAGATRIAKAHPLGAHVGAGWRLARRAWGNGYASEATRAAFDDLYRRAGVREILAYTSPDNVRSRAVMARLAMRREPELDFTADYPSGPWTGLVWSARPVLTRNGDPLTFVRATLADAERLAMHERRIAEPRLYGPPLDRDACAREIADNLLYFVELDGALAATAAWRRRDDGGACISNVAVDPDFRRRGIARAAMLFLLEKAKACTRIDLVTHPDNTAAVGLYRSLGFAVERREEDYFGDGEPRVVMLRRDVA
jgi:RimJ/RimL family protein N-acetyltransferase